MRCLRALMAGAALILVVSVVEAGPASAARGRNDGTAHACSQGRWQTIGVFKNHGDCVNGGTQLGTFGDAGYAACSAIPGFDPLRDYLQRRGAWSCTYVPGDNPPNDPPTTSLKAACASDTNAAGSFSTVDANGTGKWQAICIA